MRKYFVLVVCLIASRVALGQNALNKVVDNACKCMEKKEMNDQTLQLCLQNIMIENSDAIIKHYKASSFEKLNLEIVSQDIGMLLVQNCIVARDYLMNKQASENPTKESKTYEKSPDLKCSGLKKVKYWYVGKSDTIITNLDNRVMVMTKKNKKEVSKASVNWLNECSYELVFTESTDKGIEPFIRSKQKFICEIYQNNDTMFVLKTTIFGKELFSECTKIK